MRTLIIRVLTVVFISAAAAHTAVAQEPTPTSLPAFTPSPISTPARSKLGALITLGYKGSGSANFKEEYSEQRSGCTGGLRRNVSNEDATNLTWNITWKQKAAAGFSFYPKKASFLGKSMRTDSDDCGGQPSVCTSNLNYAQDQLPLLKIEKSGKKGFLLTITAEEQLDGYDSTASACGQSSVFDNAITDGLNQTKVTQIRIKLTPAAKSVSKKLAFTNVKTFDCTDPAKTQFFINNTCTLTMNLAGTVTVGGKWKAKLLK